MGVQLLERKSKCGKQTPTIGAKLLGRVQPCLFLSYARLRTSVSLGELVLLDQKILSSNWLIGNQFWAAQDDLSGLVSSRCESNTCRMFCEWDAMQVMQQHQLGCLQQTLAEQAWILGNYCLFKPSQDLSFSIPCTHRYPKAP